MSLLLAVCFLVWSALSPAAPRTQVSYSHVENTFRFELPLSLREASPYFGPEGERCWGGSSWDPHVLHPSIARDTRGMVFTQQQGTSSSVWISTQFDPEAGRMQYVAFRPDIVVSLIDVHLTALEPKLTQVEVTYARTALSPQANAEVIRLGTADAASAPEWRNSILGCLRR